MSASAPPSATTRVGSAGITVLPNLCVMVTGNATAVSGADGTGDVVLPAAREGDNPDGLASDEAVVCGHGRFLRALRW